MSRPPPPFTPQNPTPAPRPGGPSPSSTLPASFSNLQISRAPPPFASVGPPQGDGPVPSSIRGPQAPPPGARPFPGSPSPPGSLFARPAPSVQQSPPFGAPPAAQSLQPQRPPFNGPPPVLPAQVQRAPFGGPPAASQPLPYGGPPAAVSQLAPFGVSPVATAQSAPLGAPPYSAAQPPQFSGLSGAVSRPSYSGGSIPPFGAARAPSQQGPYGGPPQFGGERPGLQTPLFGAQTAPASQPPPFMGVPGANAPAFGPPGWQGQTRPAASSEFIVKDTGNCSPRLMRCTMNQIPCTGDLLTTSGMPLAIMVQPFALPHPSEEAIQLVDFGEMGLIRCSRCKAYINPFMRFVDQGKIFICNLCGFSNDTPREYLCNLGPDGRRRDADDRPELCRGTVEFIATKEFLVREPMPAVYFFLVDVSMNAIQTGGTAAACSAISQSLSDLPEGPRTMVGIATFDSTIHFYSLKRAQQQPLMLIVPDIQDVYTPLQMDLILPVSECRDSLEQLLESIPSMFENNRVADSAFGAAMKAGFLAMKPTGGKLLVFQSVLPSVGTGSLSARETEGRSNISSGDKEAHKLLQPVDKTLKTMALEFAEYQVCVDVFLTTQSYTDVASISVVPSTTGGRVYYYFPFSALSDPAKLFNDLRWNITRPQGYEAVMRVRCSQGLQAQDYSGNFCKRVPTDIDLPAIDSDKTIMVSFKHDDKFQENSECGFQCALLYTTVYGQRRIRVINISLPCTSMLSNLFRCADLEAQFTYVVKQAANGIPSSSLSQVRDQVTSTCINILQSYRQYCASVSSSGQLILPEALKLLPLYTLALTKSIGLRNDGRLDDRSYWVSIVSSVSVSLAVPLVFPRMIALHDLTSRDDEDPLIPNPLTLNSENIQDNGIYLLENGEDGFIHVGNAVNPATLEQIFGFSSLAGAPNLLVLEQFDNVLSRKVNEVVNEIRRQRCSYLRLRLCQKGDGDFFRSLLVEDKAPGGLSYVEFLVHVHRQIQSKMT
ncbi:hypothetical protein ACQJBY_042927 [Aegilops geniculata]